MIDRNELDLIRMKIEEAPEKHYEECLDRRTRRALARQIKNRNKQRRLHNHLNKQ